MESASLEAPSSSSRDGGCAPSGLVSPLLGVSSRPEPPGAPQGGACGAQGPSSGTAAVCACGHAAIHAELEAPLARLRHRDHFLRYACTAQPTHAVVAHLGASEAIDSASLGGGTLARPRQWLGGQLVRSFPLGVPRRPEPPGAPYGGSRAEFGHCKGVAVLPCGAHVARLPIGVLGRGARASRRVSEDDRNLQPCTAACNRALQPATVHCSLQPCAVQLAALCSATRSLCSAACSPTQWSDHVGGGAVGGPCPVGAGEGVDLGTAAWASVSQRGLSWGSVGRRGYA